MTIDVTFCFRHTVTLKKEEKRLAVRFLDFAPKKKCHAPLGLGSGLLSGHSPPT